MYGSLGYVTTFAYMHVWQWKVNSFTHSRFSICQVSRNKELKQRLDEQSLQQKEMLREIDDLRQQLQNTQQALNNEIYRKPKPPIVNR